jgi:PKD repeat protein
MNYRLILCLLLIASMVGIVNADTLIAFAERDQILYNLVSQNTYTTVRNNASGTALNPTTRFSGFVKAGTTSNQFTQINRGAIQFNTTIIPESATIDSWKVSLYGQSKTNGLGGTVVGLVTFTPTSNTSYIAADYLYTRWGETELTNNFTYAGWSTSAYNNFTGTDMSIIQKEGYTNLVLRLVSANEVHAYAIENAGNDKDPFITIVYTPAAGGSAPVASFTCTKNFLRIPNSVTCTDSSTNTPTSWSWNMGDGSAAKTTQNVTYPYMKRGLWGITLNATNAGGSNVTAVTNVKVVGYENNW